MVEVLTVPLSNRDIERIKERNLGDHAHMVITPLERQSRFRGYLGLQGFVGTLTDQRGSEKESKGGLSRPARTKDSHME